MASLHNTAMKGRSKRWPRRNKPSQITTSFNDCKYLVWSLMIPQSYCWFGALKQSSTYDEYSNIKSSLGLVKYDDQVG